MVDSLAGPATNSMPLSCNAGSSGCERFYGELYGVTDDPQKALHALLDKKEAFSLQLCQDLMSRLLDVQCSFSVACPSKHHVAVGQDDSMF